MFRDIVTIDEPATLVPIVSTFRNYSNCKMPRTLPKMDPAASSPVVADLKSLGEVVRNRRAHSRLRIDDTAAYCDVSADVLSRLENGRPVRVDKLMQVLDGLGLKMMLVTKSEAEDVSRMLRDDRGSEACAAEMR